MQRNIDNKWKASRIASRWVQSEMMEAQSAMQTECNMQ